MKKQHMKISAVIFVLSGVFCLWHPLYSADGGRVPLIHADKSIHVFPIVFEGEKLSHNFTISNKGSADLEIKQVTHS